MAFDTVTVTYHVDATDPLDAAKKAYALGYEMTPTEYQVRDETTGTSEQIELTEDDATEAKNASRDGTLFPAA